MRTGPLWVSVASIVLCVAASTAGADGTLPSYYQDPGLNPFRTTVNHNLDEHIDPFTGMLQLHHVDMVWPGNGGFDLVLQRSFNNPGPLFGTASDLMSYSHTPNIGVGWTLLIGGRALYVIEACGGGFHQFVFETPDGGRQGFHATGNGDFLSPSRWRAVCITGGVRIFDPSGTHYDLTQIISEAIPGTLSAAKFFYPTTIVDHNGNSTTFTYGTSGVFTTLASIATSDGRSLVFSYGVIPPSQQLLLGTVSTGDLTRTWQFLYYQTPAISDVKGIGIAYFLSDVKPPTGGNWSYQRILPGQVGAFGMSTVTYPEGGEIGYTYGLVNFNDGTGNTPVVIKKLAGNYDALVPALTNNTWTYAYATGSFGHNDVTTVTTPLGTMTYEHVGFSTIGAGSTWQIGLLMKTTQQDAAASSPTQVETYTWDKQQISPFPTYRGYGINDVVTYAPVMTSHAVTRYGGSLSGGSTYTTTNSNFDSYGNPGTIVETGERTHTTTRAYYIDTNKWILHTPANESTTALGSVLRQFDSNGNLKSENRYGVTTNYTYSPSDGTLTSRTDANGNSTSYGLYYRGVAQVEQRPEAVTINRGVDLAGNVTSQTDGAGNTYNYAYDGLRRLASKTPPTGAPTTITWTGNTYRTATRGGYVETLTLDGLSNPFLTSRNGIRSGFAYDALSRKIFESYPGQVTDRTGGGFNAVGTLLTRDVIGRVTLVTNEGDLSTRTYADANFAMVETDENGHAKTYHYQAFADPDKRFLTGIDLPNGNNITIGRDDLGDITSVAQGNVIRNYSYNGSYFLTAINDPETGITQFGRDAVGNMTSRTVAGKTTKFTYDGLNRLKRIDYPSSGSVTITYFGNGRTASVTNNQAARTYTYDGNANLASETLTVGGQTFTTSYTYNANDALATITYPKTSDVITYAPDALGRPTSAAPFVTTESYYDSGNAKQMIYASGVTMNFTENGRTWPNSLTAGLGGTSPNFLNKLYGYEPTGNVSAIVDKVDAQQTLIMTYDPNDQLKKVLGPWQTAAMVYDTVGNLTTYSVGNTTNTYTYDGTNRLSTVTGTLLAYDGYGNVTSDGKHTYQYDDASNLICVDCGTANEIDYAYDGNNRRVSRTKGGVATYFVHASNGDLILEYTPTTNVTLEHIYLNGKRVATKRLP